MEGGTRKRLLFQLALASVAAFGPMPGAEAHGPCGCLRPAVAQPGEEVLIGGPVLRAVWNPNRVDLPLGPPQLWAAHRGGTPTLTLLSHRRPARRERFEVPDAPADDYLVAIFDGSEGGSHYTWETLIVRRKPDDSSGAEIAVAVIVGLALSAGAVALRRRLLGQRPGSL